MGELYPRHERRTKNPAETTGNRYKIEFLMSRTQKLKGLSAASLRLKTLNDSPELEELRRRNEYLEAENALLKKVKALVEERESRLRAIGRKSSKN